jgi:hypothetical protein
MCGNLRALKNKIESSQEAAQKATSLPLLLCHGKGAYLFHIFTLLVMLTFSTPYFPLHLTIHPSLGAGDMCTANQKYLSYFLQIFEQV